MGIDRDFKGIWIPKEIWLDENLSFIEKVLLVEINSLDNEKGCFASNEYFAAFFKVGVTAISRHISKLKKFGYITQQNFDGRTRVLKSQINVICKSDLSQSTKQTCTKVQGSLDPNDKHNNIYNKTTNNKDNKNTLVLSDEEDEILSLLLEKIRLFNPNLSFHKSGSLAWSKHYAKPIQMLFRKGGKGESKGYTYDALKRIIEWLFDDSFWCTTIQSPNGLYKNISKIVPKVKKTFPVIDKKYEDRWDTDDFEIIGE